MIRDAHEANATTRPADYELVRLRAALPEYFDKDGGFKLDRLQETLSSADVSMAREGYELKFLGKSYAKYLTSTRTETVVVPDLEHNADPTNAESENLYIVGDNVDALKHLLGSYAGKVKCIYIDPPYNTGTDGFVYADDFGFTAKGLVEKLGLDEDEAQRVLALQGKSSHSAWLTFMYPRLDLAKELLTDDGVIFVSIDDNEQSNLVLLFDEIFGEQSRLGIFVQDKGNSKSDSGAVQKNHEYVVCYANPKFGVEGAYLAGVNTKTRVVHRDGDRFFYLGDPITTRAKGGVLSARKNLGYSIYFNEETRDLVPVLDYDLERATDPDAGDEIYSDDEELIGQGYVPIRPPKVRGQLGAWTWELSKVEVNKDELFPVRQGDGFAVRKRVFVDENDVESSGERLFYEGQSKVAPRSILKYSTNDGTTRVSSLVGSGVFDYPKNTDMLKYLISLVASSDDLILDFFSGAASTADAIMQLNAESEELELRYMLVQIADEVDSSGMTREIADQFQTIDEIGRERIVQAAKNITKGAATPVDTGFKLFRLQEPSAKTLDQLQSFDPNEATLLLDDFVSKFAFGGTPGAQVAIATWLVEDGFGLNAEATGVELDEYELQVCDDTGYVIKPGLTSADAMALVAKLEIGELDLKRLVIFGYSVTFAVLHELKQNLRSLRSGQTVTVIERY